MKLFLPTAIGILLLFAKSTRSSEIELSNLKSHWVGHGVSVLYPKHIKILSNRLEKQAGLLTFHNILPAGDNWEIRSDLQLKCNNFNEVSDAENDIGIGIFLTKNNPRQNVAEYSFKWANELFGMVPEIDGLSLLFNKNNLYVGLFKTKEATRSELVSRSKICKAYLQKTGKLFISVKYRSKVLGIYISEEMDKFEHPCYQFTDIQEFSEFFLTVSASDRQSKCSLDIYDLKLTSDFQHYQFVTNEQKIIEQPTFSYFVESENTKKHMQFKHFHTVYDFHRDNAKIFAKELLVFADYNEKEVVSEMKTNIQKTEKTIDDAISIIELEARQIETLNNLLNSERRSVSNDVNETLDQILKWLQTMDGMFSKVDSETQAIHTVLSNLNFDEKLDNLVNKVKSVGENLAAAIGKTKLIVKPSKMNEFDENQIDEWKIQLDTFQNSVTEKIAIKGNEKLSKLQVLGFTILGIIGFTIMIAFLIMYCKIRIAMRNKRIL